ncbi:MAG TPA: site-specific DNA-methyltransferase [Rhodoglobus sp.]|nr:site-specific DNA-methyltransferase [Rhodoglobus sp.]
MLHGSNLDLLAAVRDNFAHAVVTDPPYGLGFMGRDWDKALPDPRTWSECLRVLRPGGHLVAFGAPRLVHRLTCQIEDAGFEVRDQLLWVFGSGFPKSLDVSKAIDAAAGAVRDCTRPGEVKRDGYGDDWDTGSSSKRPRFDAPATPEAARWSGWGTALKPAYEPIVLARKPLDGTVAQTVQRWGTGAINVDGCRVETDESTIRPNGPIGYHAGGSGGVGGSAAGRWPANLILDEAAGALLDAQSGTRTSGKVTKTYEPDRRESVAMSVKGRKLDPDMVYSDSGRASRFFYCPKASRSEREAGLDHLPPRVVDPSREPDAAARQSPRTGAGCSGEPRHNHHATVKPVELMRWLVRLVTPPGGMVLEPFAGSGTTLVACALEGVDCLGMELDADYVEIARARVEHARVQHTKELAAIAAASAQIDMFAGLDLGDTP